MFWISRRKTHIQKCDKIFKPLTTLSCWREAAGSGESGSISRAEEGRAATAFAPTTKSPKKVGWRCVRDPRVDKAEDDDDDDEAAVIADDEEGGIRRRRRRSKNCRRRRVDKWERSFCIVGALSHLRGRNWKLKTTLISMFRAFKCTRSVRHWSHAAVSRPTTREGASTCVSRHERYSQKQWTK